VPYIASNNPSTEWWGGFLNPDQPTEPSVSLLVVDFGDCVSIKMERGTKEDIKLGYHVYWYDKTFGISGVSFTELKAAIEGEKPLPRLEYDRKGDVKLLLFPSDTAESTNTLQIVSGDYDGICAIAGHDLPIYESKWEQLATEPVAVWRFRMER